MSRVLIVHHAPSPRLRVLLEALEAGPRHPELAEAGVDVESVTALAATPDHVLRADGVVLLTPANFGYMSGALKHFFDTCYYTCLGELDGRPYAVCVHGDDDTTGAIAAVERIAGSWGLRKVADTLSVAGEPDGGVREAATELAATVVASLVI